MADINQIITLGVGTPSSIEHFILFGLNALGIQGVVPVSLYERLFGSATLDDRDIATGLHKRKFGSGTLEDKP